GCDPWNADFFALLADSGIAAHDFRDGSLYPGPRARRNDSGPAVLRVHRQAGPGRPARHLHGFCISAHRHWLTGRRMVWWTSDASIRGSGASTATRVVRHRRRRLADYSAAVDL